jgi:hypothetical protein
MAARTVATVSRLAVRVTDDVRVAIEADVKKVPTRMVGGAP